MTPKKQTSYLAPFPMKCKELLIEQALKNNLPISRYLEGLVRKDVIASLAAEALKKKEYQEFRLRQIDLEKKENEIRNG